MSESPGTPQGKRHNTTHHPVVLDRDKSAGIVSRGIAAIIDLAVVGAILGGGYLAVTLARLLLSVQDFSFPHPHIVFTATGFIVVSVLYLTACWAVSGRTLGCVVMGLRVVGRKGGRMRPVVALLRALICTFFPIGLAWAAVHSQRRAVADIVLRTRVVYSR